MLGFANTLENHCSGQHCGLELATGEVKVSLLEVGPAMEDTHDLEGLFQEPDDYPAGSRVWAYLSPEERLNLLLISWYLRTGLRRLFIWAAVHRGF